MYETQTSTYELASRGRRFAALFIDGLIFSVIGGIVGLNIELIGGGVISIALATAYQWYFLTRHNGQTPGKMLLDIRVIKTNGEAISDGDAILRYLGYLVGAMALGLGFIWAFFDPEKQGWHDKIARTYVVKATPLSQKTQVDYVTASTGRREAKNEDMYV